MFLISLGDVYTDLARMFGNVFLNQVAQKKARVRACRLMAMQCVGDHHLVSGPCGVEDAEH